MPKSPALPEPNPDAARLASWLTTSAAGTPLAEALDAWLTAIPAAGHLRHGDWPRWLAAIAAVDSAGAPLTLDASSNAATVPVPHAAAETLAHALQALRPWRKGPFQLGDTAIDTEWRSDMKWQRIAPQLGSLTNEAVLDVGCGSGWFGWPMLAAGARLVVGLEPMAKYVAQHELVKHLAAPAPNFVLPLRLEDVPAPAGAFDTVFSMGVLYHQRDHAAHLADLMAQARPGGRIVLETLVLPDAPRGEPAEAVLTPEDRYAGMRNVWALPTVALLERWLREAGLTALRCVDVTATTSAEQRATAWTTPMSLSDALDPAAPNRTVEGHPAPRRATVIGTVPGGDR